jgi:acyl transferase domain-containing protein
MDGMLREPVAIIGIGCRFPKANNPKAFWQLLREGVNAVSEVPTDRWDITQLYDRDPNSYGKMSSRWGGFIDNVDQFDWQAFRIPPREAQYMDPQHRLLLEVVWEALEDAGLPLEKLAGSRTSVFQGVSSNDYLRLQARAWSQLDGYTITGNDLTFVANRISYFFDFKGPSVTISMACVASLVAVHYACQSLWTGEADLAIAGGVNLMLSPDINIMLSRSGVLSPDGFCKTLDARADGYVRGEGAGIVVLKLLSQVTSSDRVYALIRGTAVNHNGHNEWIMAANPTAQETVIRDAYHRAGVELSEVDYVELHGTGLPKGDPIEVKALGAAIGNQHGRSHPCIIGSVKTNIGHLEAASGIASLIKVALSLYLQEIPPTLHLQQVNPNISLEALGLTVQQKLGSWPRKVGPHLAGVTAVSMAGVNAHAVLESPLQHQKKLSFPQQSEADQVYLLPLSSRSPAALTDLARAFKDFLTTEESSTSSLRDICYTASVRRSHHEHRLAIVGHSRQDFVKSLESFLQGQLSTGVFSTKAPKSSSKLVFVFPGQVPQKWTLGPDLLKENIFQKTLEKCDRMFYQHTNWSLLASWGANESLLCCEQSETAQLALFAFQVAIASVWRSWGIEPNAVIGDGIGEITATYVAGASSLEDAVSCLVTQLRNVAEGTRDKGQGTNHKKTSVCDSILNYMVENGYTVFLELGPHSVLSESLSESLLQITQEGTILASLYQNKGEYAAMFEALGSLYTFGYKINWDALYLNQGQCVRLPTYPWQRERLWLDWLDIKTMSTAPEQTNGDIKQRDENSIGNKVASVTRETILNAEPSQRQQLLESYLCERVASVLGLPTSNLDAQLPLNQLGLNSITALEVKYQIEANLGITIPVTMLLEGLQISQVAAQVLLNHLSEEDTAPLPALNLNKTTQLSELNKNIQTRELVQSSFVDLNEGWEEFRL